MNLTKGIQKSFGPGIVLAGAAIGGSHLLSSTTAGARFGFSLVGLILLTNLLKYPFLLVGTRFTASTGKSLLEGFKERNSLYLPLFLIVSLITGTFTIAAVSFLTAPLFAWMAMDNINSKLVPFKNRYGFFLKTISWIGLIFLRLFSLLFVVNSFFGLGIY